MTIRMRYSVRTFAIGMITILLLAGLAGIGVASPTLSNSGGGSWQYYKEITINENSGSTLTDYQVQVQLSGSNFPTNIRSDGADIRFTDADGNELSYWIESWDYSGRSGKIWVKISDISAGGSAIIYLYYGNPSASSASNGNNVFELFDNFDETSINSNKWTQTSETNIDNLIGNPSPSVKIAENFYTGEGIISKQRFDGENLIIEAQLRSANSKPWLILGYTDNGFQDQTSPCCYFSNGYFIMGHTDTSRSISNLQKWTSGSQQNIGSPAQNLNPMTWLDYRLIIKDSGVAAYSKLASSTSWSIISETSDTTFIASNYKIIVGGAGVKPSDYVNIDNVKVRKYSSSEPTVTFGTEQSILISDSTPQQQTSPDQSSVSSGTDKQETETSYTPQITSTQTVTIKDIQSTPEPTSSSIPSEYLYGGAGFALLFLLLVALIKRKPKKSTEGMHLATSDPVLKQPESKPYVKPDPISTKNIDVKTAFGYKGAIIQYKVKIENPTSEPIGDVKISLYVPDVFLISESTKNIPMLKPGESKTATFEIRPTGECGDCEVSGRVVYYDYSAKKTSEIDILARSLSIVCLMLHSREISDAELRSLLSKLAKAEESTKEIDMPAETLFNISTRILRDMNMYMLEPEITSTPQLYNAVARFYAEGVKDLKYAAQIEVVGGAKKSSLILKIWAENEESLTGFYHGILDEIEKRVKVKDYINDSIVQQNIHIGDNIGAQVKDSVVQRSNIGVGERKCPNCGREVESNEKFCLECGAKL